jgi:hypothetical protein
MSIVARLRRAKRIVNIKRKTLRYLKRLAHKTYRRAAKIAIRQDKEINEKPRLTGWDIA